MILALVRRFVHAYHVAAAEDRLRNRPTPDRVRERAWKAHEKLFHGSVKKIEDRIKRNAAGGSFICIVQVDSDECPKESLKGPLAAHFAEAGFKITEKFDDNPGFNGFVISWEQAAPRRRAK